MRDQIQVADIRNVYSGRHEGCRCGCNGKYSYASKFVTEGSKARGYAVDQEDVNDRMVAKVVRIINERLNDEATIIDDDYVDVTMENGHIYTAYFCTAAKKARENEAAVFAASSEI